MLFLVLALAFVGAATEARTKRDTAWVPSDPQAFEVKLGFDKAGRYVLDVGMGKPFSRAGNFTFLLSTSSPYTGVAAVGCATCVADVGNQTQIYNISSSSSAVRSAKSQSLSMGKGVISGALIRETCVLTKGNGTKWAYDNQTVIMVQNTAGVFGSGAQGILGLGRSSGNDSFITGVLQSRGWSKMLFGLAVSAYDSTANATTEQSAGSLTVRELNTNLYSGQISWQPLAKVTDAPSNIPTDWALNFDSYQLGFGSQSTFSSGGAATVDPYFPEVRIPSTEAIGFFGNIPNAQMTNDSNTLSWVVPCDQDFTLAIAIANSTIRVKKEQLIDSTGTVCTSLVKGWADSRIRSYLLGKPFAASAYIAYSALANPSSDQIGVAPRVGHTTTIVNKGVSIRTVVITIVSSIVGVAVVAALLFLFMRWWRQRSSTERPVKKEDVIEPFNLPAPRPDSAPPHSATPLVRVTGGESGWIIEQGSIGAEPGTHDRSSVQYGYSPRMRDNKSPLPLPSPNLNLVRQSQITVSSGEHSPRLDEVHPLMATSASKNQFRPESQQVEGFEGPDIPDGLAPPPYERNER